MKKGNKKNKTDYKKKFSNKSSIYGEETYKKYNEPKNVFNLASLDKIREEYNDPKKVFVNIKDRQNINISQEESNSDENSGKSKSDNDKYQSDSDYNSDEQKPKKFDIKLFMMVNNFNSNSIR